MKRTRNHYKASIPRKKLRADGTWEDSMITPRIIDLFEKLYYSLYGNGTHFFQCLEEEDCTEEEFIEVSQIRFVPFGDALLHQAFEWLDFEEAELPTVICIIRKLIEASPSLTLARNCGGSIALHSAALYNAPIYCLKLLLNADPSKSSLLVRNNSDCLPLHSALDNCNNDIATIQLLYDSENKKEILDAEDEWGRTPLRKAFILNHPGLTLLAEDRIQLVPGIPSWRKRFRHMVQKYQEIKESIDIDKRVPFRRYVFDLFKRVISEFEDLYQVMPLLELGVWKGRGLPGNKEDRQARWITCGAQQIAPRVAEFLGMDAIGMLRSEVDRICNYGESPSASDSYLSDSDSSDDSDELDTQPPL